MCVLITIISRTTLCYFRSFTVLEEGWWGWWGAITVLVLAGPVRKPPHLGSHSLISLCCNKVNSLSGLNVVISYCHPATVNTIHVHIHLGFPIGYNIDQNRSIWKKNVKCFVFFFCFFWRGTLNTVAFSKRAIFNISGYLFMDTFAPLELMADCICEAFSVTVSIQNCGGRRQSLGDTEQGISV